MSKDQPQFPIFIPTLSRYDTRYTIKALAEMNVSNWYAVVEPQEFDAYASVIPKEKIIVLDLSYKEKYRTLDKLGTTKSVGPGAARNFIWDTAVKMGFAWHWVMDDNIFHFHRYNFNRKLRMLTGAGFRVMEDFCLRYENIGMAGPQYRAFIAQKSEYPPFVLNTRIYSCNLIRNDLPYRWRGRYNEDTILSLDMLKDGWCTVQFNAFLQDKAPTQTIKGGNDAVFYSREGTMPKSAMLVKEYPQYARLAMRFGRIHHFVDYTPFKRNKLKRKRGVEIATGNDEFGMKLVDRKSAS